MDDGIFRCLLDGDSLADGIARIRDMHLPEVIDKKTFLDLLSLTEALARQLDRRTVDVYFLRQALRSLNEKPPRGRPRKNIRSPLAPNPKPIKGHGAPVKWTDETHGYLLALAESGRRILMRQRMKRITDKAALLAALEDGMARRGLRRSRAREHLVRLYKQLQVAKKKIGKKIPE